MRDIRAGKAGKGPLTGIGGGTFPKKVPPKKPLGTPLVNSPLGPTSAAAIRQSQRNAVSLPYAVQRGKQIQARRAATARQKAAAARRKAAQIHLDVTGPKDFPVSNLTNPAASPRKTTVPRSTPRRTPGAVALGAASRRAAPGRTTGTPRATPGGSSAPVGGAGLGSASAPPLAKGSGGGGGGYNVGNLGILNQQQLDDLVNQYVQASVDPEKMAIQNEQDQYNASAQRQAQDIQGFTQAYASLMGGVAPETSKFYSDAANADASFAQGFTGQIRADASADAAKEADYLQNVQHADPAGAAKISGQNVGGLSDVLYGLGGYNPSTHLSTLGAAEASAAARLPYMARGVGEQNLMTLFGKTRTDNMTFGDKMAELMAKVPALRLQIQSQLEDQQTKRIGLAQNQRYLDAKLANELGLPGTPTDRRINISRANALTSRDRLALSKWTAQNNWTAKMKSLGIQEKRAQTQYAQLQMKLENGGFTPTQVAKLKSSARTMAANLHGGFTDPKGKDHPPLSWGAALREMLKGDPKLGAIPLPLALEALRFYYKPGELGRPKNRKKV